MSVKTTFLAALAFLVALTPAASAEASCSVGLKDEALGMHAVVESCSSVGSFSMGGLYNGVWEKLTYSYPEPWKGTFISVKVDDVVYVSSDDPADGVLMDQYASARPGISGSAIAAEWVLPENILVTESIRLAKNTTLIEIGVANRDSNQHEIGVRIHLDTMLGLNDGAPIYLPGEGLRTSEVEYADVPFEYWKAYNTPDKPTIVATGLLDPKSGMTQPSRIIVAEWKKSKNSAWDYEATRGLSVLGDSAVLLYYPLGRVEPGGKSGVVLGVGSERPILPTEKGTFGITEVLADRVSGEYCPGDDVNIKVDVLSEDASRSGRVKLTVKDAGSVVRYENTIGTSFPAGSVKPVNFIWKIKGEENYTLLEEYDVEAQLLNSSGSVDVKTREGLVKIDSVKCRERGFAFTKLISGVVSDASSLILAVALLVVLLFSAALVLLAAREKYKGGVEVSKIQDRQSVQIRVANKTRKTMEDVVVEEAIPSNAEIDVSTLSVVRKEDHLVWDVGDIKPGGEALLEYTLKEVAAEPDVLVKWRGGVKTSKVGK